jgi:hypothetical protein
MSYVVELTRAAARKIHGWNPSSHLYREILKGLDQLADNPNRHLIRVGPPHDVLQYDLIVREPVDPPRDHLFVSTVLYATDEERLLVVECDHDFEERRE